MQIMPIRVIRLCPKVIPFQVAIHIEPTSNGQQLATLYIWYMTVFILTNWNDNDSARIPTYFDIQYISTLPCFSLKEPATAIKDFTGIIHSTHDNILIVLLKALNTWNQQLMISSDGQKKVNFYHLHFVINKMVKQNCVI